jgi:hypothetical protein
VDWCEFTDVSEVCTASIIRAMSHSTQPSSKIGTSESPWHRATRSLQHRPLATLEWSWSSRNSMIPGISNGDFPHCRPQFPSHLQKKKKMKAQNFQPCGLYYSLVLWTSFFLEQSPDTRLYHGQARFFDFKSFLFLGKTGLLSPYLS